MEWKELNRRKDTVENFFKTAFCAEKAEILSSFEGFKISSIIRMHTGDERGIIHVAIVESKNEDLK